MKKIFPVFCLFVLYIILGIPTSTHAAEVTDQSAVRLDENTILFTLTSRFSYMNYELSMPGISVRNSQFGVAYPNLGYALVNKDGTAYTAGETYSALLSNEKIVGNQYVVPTGEAGFFTLVVLLKSINGFKEAGNPEELFMSITTQPFTLKQGTEKIESQLDAPQLSTFKTKSIKL